MPIELWSLEILIKFVILSGGNSHCDVQREQKQFVEIHIRVQACQLPDQS